MSKREKYIPHYSFYWKNSENISGEDIQRELKIFLDKGGVIKTLSPEKADRTLRVNVPGGGEYEEIGSMIG